MLIGLLVTILIVFLVLYLINMLPLDAQPKMICQIIVVIIAVVALLRYLPGGSPI